LPTLLFRARLGWVLGKRFLLLHHNGRRSGRLHTTVLEVVARNESTSSYYVAAGLGDRADWYQNLLVHPDVEIEVGLRRSRAIAERLPAPESEAVLAAYARDHPLAYRSLGRLFGFHSTTARALAERFPIVRLHTTEPVRGETLRTPTTFVAGQTAVGVAGLAMEAPDEL
jgi:deazaflavin-dependent oxidoreductase (nitroreductase family)